MANSKDAHGALIANALTAAVMISAACFAGYADGRLLNDRDARNYFYLTNPDGPAGDYRAHTEALHRCAPGLRSVGEVGCQPSERAGLE